MFTMNSCSELSAILFLLYKNAALIAPSLGIVMESGARARFVHHMNMIIDVSRVVS